MTTSEDTKNLPLGGLLGGVLISQIVDSALHLAQPLLILKLSGSFGDAALFSAFDTSIHMAGSFMGGWPADRIGARTLLIVSTALRAAALAFIPIAWAANVLTLNGAMAAYTLDAFVRGFTDTAVHTLPLELGEKNRAELDLINSRYELAFELGGVAGPLMMGMLMLWFKTAVVHAVIPIGFIAAALAFVAIPSGRLTAQRLKQDRTGGTLEGIRLALRDKTLLMACLGLALLNLYPLRKLLSAFFAKGILFSAASAGWLGAAFGLGGAAGALLYGCFADSSSAAEWIGFGACGAIILAAGWIPQNLFFMMAAAFVFSLANAGARLAVTRRMQQATPLNTAGGVTAAARFGATAASALFKALVGLAFILKGGIRFSFTIVGLGLGLMALFQFALASRFTSSKDLPGAWNKERAAGGA